MKVAFASGSASRGVRKGSYNLNRTRRTERREFGGRRNSNSGNTRRGGKSDITDNGRRRLGLRSSRGGNSQRNGGRIGRGGRTRGRPSRSFNN